MHALLETIQRVFSLRSVPWLYIWDNKAKLLLACLLAASGGNIKLQLRSKPLFGEHVLIIYSVIREMPIFQKDP
jgi:hypothetical protein